jgi:hypothetical protein
VDAKQVMETITRQSGMHNDSKIAQLGDNNFAKSSSGKWITNGMVNQYGNSNSVTVHQD